MLDFTSSLYLAMRHGSDSLGGWTQLTTGVPPALGMPTGAAALGERIAALQGCAHTALYPSTLHAFWDLCDALCEERVAILVDAGTYAVAARGVERARLRGVSVQTFTHHDPGSLEARIARLERGSPRGRRPTPVVVTDGFCPACGRAAPLGAYLHALRRLGGKLVIDDTQALGILGASTLRSPYGTGGGGTVKRLGIGGDDILVVASLAKAFGAPLAAVSGARSFVAPLERTGASRAHSSGISTASVRAAEHALDENDARGEALRWRLFDNVSRFRSGLDWPASGGCFPLQAPAEMTTAAASRVQSALRREGVLSVLLRGGCGGTSTLARVGFVLNAAMDRRAIDAANAALERALAFATVMARHG